MLRARSPRFATLYAPEGRPSLAPEKRLRALPRQGLSPVRSARRLLEPLDDHVLVRGFVGLPRDDPGWAPTVFTKHRDRRLDGEVAPAFVDQVLAQARLRHRLSAEHFTIDGTLIEAWAGQQSFMATAQPSDRPTDAPGNPTGDFHGERRPNATRRSTTDPEARLYKKAAGQEATRCDPGPGLLETRHGLVVDTRVPEAPGTGEREATRDMAEALPGIHRKTLGGEPLFATHDFVRDVRALGVTPQVAQHTTGRASAIDGRTTRHPGYAISQRCRKRVEEVFGGLQTVGLLRKPRHRGWARGDGLFPCTTAVYHLVRIRTLLTVSR